MSCEGRPETGGLRFPGELSRARGGVKTDYGRRGGLFSRWRLRRRSRRRFGTPPKPKRRLRLLVVIDRACLGKRHAAMLKPFRVAFPTFEISHEPALQLSEFENEFHIHVALRRDFAAAPELLYRGFEL